MQEDILKIMEMDEENSDSSGGSGNGTEIPDTPIEGGGTENPGETPDPGEGGGEPGGDGNLDPEPPSIPSIPIKTPQQMIDELHEEIKGFKEEINKRRTRIREIDIMRSRLLVPAIIIESNHYYQSVEKLYVFKQMEQKELLERFRKGLAPETVGRKNLEQLLLYLNVPHEFYGREHTLYICLEPRFNFDCGCNNNNNNNNCNCGKSQL